MALIGQVRDRHPVGDAERIDELAIEWASRQRTVLTDLAVDWMHAIREGPEYAFERP